MKAKPIYRYEAVISAFFQDHFRPGMDRFEFTRDAFVAKASALGFRTIDNPTVLPCFDGFTMTGHPKNVPTSSANSS